MLSFRLLLIYIYIDSYLSICVQNILLYQTRAFVCTVFIRIVVVNITLCDRVYRQKRVQYSVA